MKICVWRYLDNEKNYSGYNLSSDATGCAYVKERLSDQWPKSSIPLTTPDSSVLSVPNNMEGKARVRAASKLKVLIDESADHDSMLIEEDEGVVSITMSKITKSKFIKGIEDIENGEGDYALGDDENSIWFWWWPASRKKANNTP